MATATESAPKNTVTISDAGPSRKKVSIEIPADAVTGKVKDSMDALVGSAELPGFRKGKAPRGLIEKRFGANVRSEAKQQLVSAAFQAAIDEHKLKIVGDPVSESLTKAELVDGKPFAFELEVEVMPEFELPSLEGITVLKPIVEVTDEMVEKELTNLRVNEGDLESRDTAEPGDYITGHAVMTDDKGTEFYNIKGAVVQSPATDKQGKGMILGIMVDDFSGQIGSPKAGDVVSVKAKGPENHELEGVRNANLTITFTVERVDRIIAAPMDKVLAGVGMQTEDQLKDAIRTRLNQRVMVQQQSAMRQQLAQYLVESTKIDLPQRLTAQQAARTLERRRLELMYRGAEPAKIEEHMAELRSSSATVAANDLKLSFILGRAAEELKVRVDENEVNNRIYQMAMERGVRPEKLRQEIIQTNQAGGIFQQIRDHKVMDQILSKSTITELPAEEFNKKMKDASAKV